MKRFLNIALILACLLADITILHQIKTIRFLRSELSTLAVNAQELLDSSEKITKSGEELLAICTNESAFRQALSRVDTKYDRQANNCLDHSQRLQKELRRIGIESSIFINKGRNHAWLAVWIEATTGEFIRPGSGDFQPIEVRDHNMNVILRDPIYSKVPVPTEGQRVWCLGDVKECADGSFVGRQWPMCEFAQCK